MLAEETYLGACLFICKHCFQVFAEFLYVWVVFLGTFTFICRKDFVWSQNTVLELENSLTLLLVPRWAKLSVHKYYMTSKNVPLLVLSYRKSVSAREFIHSLLTSLCFLSRQRSDDINDFPAGQFFYLHQIDTILTVTHMIFFTSSSGTWNLRNKSLALFNDKRRKSASVPVTVLLGCASCSSLLCYEKKLTQALLLDVAILTVGLFGTRT